MTALRASEFLVPIKGNIEGTCVICGYYTKYGHKVKLSDNFTMWSLLQEGNCICEYCYELLKNQDYRRKSWIATTNGVKFIKRHDVLPFMLKPEVPFAMYITRTGKKQGFLHIVNRVNYSREHYFVAFDDELIYVNRGILVNMVDVATEARKLGFRKMDLIDPATRMWKYRDLCNEIVKYKGNPLWRLVVYAVD